jgi:4-hydroxy-3-methylbut-2-enyl diphosphate reductase
MGRLNLSVTVDSRSGFCFGVSEAINRAEEELANSGNLSILGEIVHNESEVERLGKMGLKVINHSEMKDLQSDKVMFRAHGEPPSSYEAARKNNLKIIDATCPVVLKLQKRIRTAYEEGHSIYIFGKTGHPEVTGLLGQIDGQAVVFSRFEDLDISGLPEKITVFSQTTMSVSGLYEAVRQLEAMGVQVSLKDTICRQVSNREQALTEFSKGFDRIIFVSGKKSSNGKVLYDVCRRANPKSYFVGSADELEPGWFEKDERIGVCGATSTPKWLMQEIELKLRSF